MFSRVSALPEEATLSNWEASRLDVRRIPPRTSFSPKTALTLSPCSVGSPSSRTACWQRVGEAAAHEDLPGLGETAVKVHALFCA